MDKLIIISSSDKEVTTSVNNSEFTVQLKTPTLVQNVNRVYIKSWNCPNIFYNIEDGKNGEQNNLFVFRENGEVSDTIITIPAGQYTLAEYMADLEALMNTDLVSGTVVITLHDRRKELIFTFTGTSAIIYNYTDGNLNANVAGFLVTTVDSALIQGDSPVALNGLQTVYLHCREIGLSHAINGASNGFISTLDSLSFANTPFGQYVSKQNNDRFLSEISFQQPRNLGTLSFTYRDEHGNKLNVKNHSVDIDIICALSPLD